MERNTVTTVDKLNLGDRFYCLSDKKKQPYTVVESKYKITKYQTYKHRALKDGERHPVFLNATKQVVFLRSTNKPEPVTIAGEK